MVILRKSNKNIENETIQSCKWLIINIFNYRLDLLILNREQSIEPVADLLNIESFTTESAGDQGV